MGGRGKKTGKCHLCGRECELTFEHVPPKKAFNNRRTISISFEKALKLGPDVPLRGKIEQGGVGGYTLCERCNTGTGDWYARALIDWCYRGMEILERSGGRPELVHLYRSYPLRILKEILVMFCSVNGDRFTDAQPWLRKFLLNRDAREFDESFRIFVYYNLSGKLRYVGLAGMLDISTGRMTLLSEITYPPFGYVLTINSAPPDARLAEITFFRRFRYNDLATLEVRLPVLPTHLLYPGDYRSRKDIVASRSPP